MMAAWGSGTGTIVAQKCFPNYTVSHMLTNNYLASDSPSLIHAEEPSELSSFSPLCRPPSALTPARPLSNNKIRHVYIEILYKVHLASSTKMGTWLGPKVKQKLLRLS